MKNNPKDSPLCNQVFSLPGMVEEQVEICFSPEQLEQILPIKDCFDIRKVFLTGCGDSLAAAGNMTPIIEKYCDIMSCKALDPITFTRYMTKSDIGIGEPNSPLVLSISAGGETARVVEVLKKASELGAFPLVITGKPDSTCAETAKKAFIMWQFIKFEQQCNNDCRRRRNYSSWYNSSQQHNSRISAVVGRRAS